jgi:hypothetical protein
MLIGQASINLTQRPFGAVRACERVRLHAAAALSGDQQWLEV